MDKKPSKPKQISSLSYRSAASNIFDYLVHKRKKQHAGFSLHGHQEAINSVSISPDNKLIASGSWDAKVKLWSFESRSEIFSFDLHSASVESTAFSHNGSFIASGSVDESIKVWNVHDKTLEFTLNGHTDWVNSVKFSHDNNLIISGSEDKIVKIWDFNTRMLINTLKFHNSAVYAVDISHNDGLIASCSLDRSIKIWALNTKKPVIFSGHKGLVSSISFSGKGTYLASGSGDKNVMIWNLHTKKQHFTFKGHTEPVFSVNFSKDEKFVVSGSEDLTIKLWDVIKKCEVLSYNSHEKLVKSVVFDSSCAYIISGSYDGSIIVKPFNQFYDDEYEHKLDSRANHLIFSMKNSIIAFSSNKKIHVLNLKHPKNNFTQDSNSEIINTLIFSHDCKYIISGSFSGKLLVWDIDGKKLDFVLTAGKTCVKSVNCSQNNEYIACSISYNIIIWDFKTRIEYFNFNYNLFGDFFINFSEDSKYLNAYSCNNGFLVYDVKCKTETHKFHEEISRGIVNARFISNNQKVLTVYNTGKIGIIDLNCMSLDIIGDYNLSFYSALISNNGRMIILFCYTNTIHAILVEENRLKKFTFAHQMGYNLIQMIMSDDGTKIILYSIDNSLKVYDIRKELERVLLEENTNLMNSIIFSPNKQFVANGSYDNSLTVWNTKNLNIKKIFPGHTSWIRATTFSPDQKFIASASIDQTIRVWNLHKSTEEFCIYTGSEWVLSLAFSSNGQFLACGTFDSCIRIWDVQSKTEEFRFEDFEKSVKFLKFSSSGRLVLSVLGNKEICVWDLETKRKVFMVKDCMKIWSIDLCMSGKYLVSKSGEEHAKVWKIILS